MIRLLTVLLAFTIGLGSNIAYAATIPDISNLAAADANELIIQYNKELEQEYNQLIQEIEEHNKLVQEKETEIAAYAERAISANDLTDNPKTIVRYPHNPDLQPYNVTSRHIYKADEEIVREAFESTAADRNDQIQVYNEHWLLAYEDTFYFPMNGYTNGYWQVTDVSVVGDSQYLDYFDYGVEFVNNHGDDIEVTFEYEFMREGDELEYIELPAAPTYLSLLEIEEFQEILPTGKIEENVTQRENSVEEIVEVLPEEVQAENQKIVEVHYLDAEPVDLVWIYAGLSGIFLLLLVKIFIDKRHKKIV